MKITSETSLRNFDFWGPAKSVAEELTIEELDEIEFNLESLYPEGLDATELNDILSFETEFIEDIIGRELYS